MITPTNDGIVLSYSIIKGITTILVLSEDFGQLLKANPDLIQSIGDIRSAVYSGNLILQGLRTLL